MLPVSRAEVAEAAKLVENVYRAVNIALVHFLKKRKKKKKIFTAPSILRWFTFKKKEEKEKEKKNLLWRWRRQVEGLYLANK